MSPHTLPHTVPYAVPRVTHWPPALISAALRQGTLVESGPGYRPASWPDSSLSRCTSIAQHLTPRYAASDFTAAWVLGIADHPGTVLRLTTTHGRVPAFQSAPGVEYREFSFEPGELIQLGSFWVTSPARTAFDLIRSTLPFTPLRATASDALLRLGRASWTHVAERAGRSSNVDRARVLSRLDARALDTRAGA